MTKPFAFSQVVRDHVKAIAHAADRINARNELTRKLFDADIRRVGWQHLRAAQPLPIEAVSHAIVIGAVWWSGEDLATLAEFSECKLSRDTEVYVFNLDDVQSQSALNRLAPGVPLPQKTPLVAEYSAGMLRRHGDGDAARALLKSLCLRDEPAR